ncbi:transposase family protein (plasmid) [Borreliella spielmanii A14S]|uniref:Transposase family protein n=1 Tax=Borreliella spielmanii A14S TaxID=498742 RepID=C0RCD8_9SPIR|nr:transposase family protein [Borreliella spielmanii A14S]
MSHNPTFNTHCVYSINYHLVLVTKYKHKCYPCFNFIKQV